MDKEKVNELILKATSLEFELVWLPKIMGNQTDTEIECMCTVCDNKLGLNNNDAPIVTAYFMRVKRGAHLTDGQANVLRKILPKYWRQFARMSNGNEKKV